ncbi:hypothetical protein [uncultured Muribaculum sp.]|uniref:hypothetical protein n=1 Tax=uncultured Muribaculum sp. TaxID=1918613 RepID=UPI0025B05203|nr:hypothetical protein [uncultured Muribaculum sp.]
MLRKKNSSGGNAAAIPSLLRCFAVIFGVLSIPVKQDVNKNNDTTDIKHLEI